MHRVDNRLTCLQQHAGPVVVVGLRGKEQRRADVLIHCVHIGAVLDEQLQNVRRAGHTSSVVQGSVGAEDDQSTVQELKQA